MSFFVAGALFTTTMYTNIQARKATKKANLQAKEDALEADKQARKSEVFAETEGEGIGNLGKISLEVDDEIDEESSKTKNVVRI